MMKLTKPISSPGRTTSTNPPPLMKFLRNKSSSTRRRPSSSSTRARSPMFFRKKHTQISHIQQEPSSPKVTCIGQIKHKHPNKKNQNPNPKHFCQCLRTLKPSFLCKVLTKWVSFFRCGYCENSPKNNKQQHTQSRQSDVSGPENNSSPKKVTLNETRSFSKDRDVNKNDGVLLKSPPKNAFLLTRCSSAPYRSTSLASKLCETSVEEEVKNLEVKKDGYEDVNEGVISGDEELMVIKGIEGIKEREMPLFLTRCKSESGRKWDKFLGVKCCHFDFFLTSQL